MRIALLQDHLRPGGTEQQTLAIARGLAEQGHDLRLIVFRRGGALEPSLPSAPFATEFLPQGPFRFDWFAPRLASRLRQLQPDAVLPMGRMANCHAGLLAARPRPYRLLATFRTGRPIPYLYRKALRQADHIVANSQEALQRLAASYRIHRPDDSSVIYNGCIRDFETTIPAFAPSRPIDRFQAPSEGRPKPSVHFVNVSMFRPQKRQDRLLRICAQLPNALDWRLTLAGEGSTRAACQALAEKLGIARRVSFPGFLRDPRALYADADIALHASEKESLPNFLVEAQMAGLPVIAYDVNGAGETFLHERSGLLIPHQNEPAFLAALQALAADPQRQVAMADAARAFARKAFSLSAQTKAYQSLLAQITGNRLPR